MAWILVHSLKNEIGGNINDFINRNPDLLISRLNHNLYILKNNGKVLTYLTKRKIMDKEWLELYAIEPLELYSMPEKVKEVGGYLANHPRTTIKKAIKHIPEIKDVEELIQCQIRFARVRDLE